MRVAAGPTYPKNGTNAFTLDKGSFSNPASANFLTLNVDLSNYTSAAGIELGFSVLESLQEPNPDNRVWVRGGIADPWIQIVDLDAITLSGSYVDVANVDIVNPLANAGQTVGSETQIRFGQAGTTTSSSITCCDGFTFDDISLVEVTCPTPTGLTATGITGGAANLTWNPTSSSVNYQVWFGPTGFSQGSNTVGGVQVFTGGADSLFVDTLSSNTCYEYLLRYVCAVGDTSIWVGPFQFCTECATYQAPYLEGFEGIGTAVGHYDAVNGDCWNFTSNNPGTTSSGGYSWEVRTTSQTTSGTGTGPDRDNTLAPAIGGRFITADVSGSSTAGPDSTILTSPLIDISSLTNPEFQFYYHMLGTNMADLHVDIWDGNSWDRDEIVITGTHHTSQSDPYNDTIYDLSAYLGSANLKVRFRARTNGCCSGDVAIDDIRISDPISCVAPQNLNVSAITTTGGTISWDAAAGQLGTSFQVSYGISLSDPALGSLSVTSSTSSVLSNLPGNSYNCFFVREICGPGDTSLWAGPFCFKTLCSSFTAPYIQDFETSALGHWDGEEDCWDYTSNNAGTTSSGGYSWEVRNTAQTTSGTGTGPDRDNTLAPATGGRFVTADVSGSSTAGPDSTIISSPAIDISGLTNPELEYHFHMHGTGMADLYVDLWNGTGWDRGVHLITGTHNASQADPYNDTIINLSAYSGQTDFRARFRVLTNGCCSGDVALDDIRISNAGATPCLPPTAFASGQVDCDQLEFTFNSVSGSSIIQYGSTGFALGSGLFTNIVSSPVFVTNLIPGTNYDFYIADTCGGDTSNFAGPFTFMTAAGPLSASFTLVNQAPTLTNQVVDVDASTSQGASTYTWDWGDATPSSTFSIPTASHTYTVDGSYNIKLTISGACGLDSIIQASMVTGISLSENVIGRSLAIYPNPTLGIVNLNFVSPNNMAEISLTDLSGKILKSQDAKVLNGEFNSRLNISGFAKGTYILRIESGDLSVQRRIVKK